MVVEGRGVPRWKRLHLPPPAGQVALCPHPWVWPWAKTGIQRGMSISSHRAEKTGEGFRFLWSSQKDLVPNKRLWVLSQEAGFCQEKASAQYSHSSSPTPPRSDSAPQQYLGIALSILDQQTELRECRDIKTSDNEDLGLGWKLRKLQRQKLEMKALFSACAGRQSVQDLDPVPNGSLYNVFKGWDHKVRESRGGCCIDQFHFDTRH